MLERALVIAFSKIDLLEDFIPKTIASPTGGQVQGIVESGNAFEGKAGQLLWDDLSFVFPPAQQRAQVAGYIETMPSGAHRILSMEWLVGRSRRFHRFPS